jgi:hypothetical protein
MLEGVRAWKTTDFAIPADCEATDLALVLWAARLAGEEAKRNLNAPLALSTALQKALHLQNGTPRKRSRSTVLSRLQMHFKILIFQILSAIQEVGSNSYLGKESRSQSRDRMNGLLL